MHAPLVSDTRAYIVHCPIYPQPGLEHFKSAGFAHHTKVPKQPFSIAAANLNRLWLYKKRTPHQARTARHFQTSLLPRRTGQSIPREIEHDTSIMAATVQNGQQDHHTAPGIEKTASHPDSINGMQANGANNTQRYDYGGNPMFHAHSGPDGRLAAFGGEFQPGLYKSTEARKFANPAPLGLSAFALTTFVLSLINCSARGMSKPNVVVTLAFAYGGVIQLAAGMW